MNKLLATALDKACLDLVLESGGVDTVRLANEAETAIVEAVWTLRRLPSDGVLLPKGMKAAWPEIRPSRHHDYKEAMTPMEARLATRPTRREIDAMQPNLDLLALLSDPYKSKLVFWAAWYQEGDVGRVPWARVAIQIKSKFTRQTMRSHYRSALETIGALKALREG